MQISSEVLHGAESPHTLLPWNVAAIICNYNKADYVKKCIQSLREQTFPIATIYLVDNASTDGTARIIRELYGDAVRILSLPQNLGGAGGFNAGLREAERTGYHAYLLLDNDVVLQEDAVAQLVAQMQHNHRLGIEGCNILKMDAPDTIQEFAPVLDTAHVNFILRYRGERASATDLPPLSACDYTAACALMIRAETLAEIGRIPERNFIYYDDIEWCALARKAGWLVAANAAAKVWHKGGAAMQETTFSVYYMNRNKTKFFMKYFPGLVPGSAEEARAIKERAEAILLDLFEGCWVCGRQGQENVRLTRIDAFLDALEGKSGPAAAYEIRPHENTYFRRFEKECSPYRRIALFMDGHLPATRNVLEALARIERRRNAPFDVTLVDDALAAKGARVCGIEILPYLPVGRRYDAVFHVCPHIYGLTAPADDTAYVDGWRNLLVSAEDREDFNAFHKSYKVFHDLFIERLIEKIKEVRRL